MAVQVDFHMFLNAFLSPELFDVLIKTLFTLHNESMRESMGRLRVEVLIFRNIRSLPLNALEESLKG